jgi:creatinine amidohydrolase
MSELGDLAWPEVRTGVVLLVPLGSTEQHGPHLPLSTDTDLATAICRGVAARLPAVVAPALPYGASGEHQSFDGTLSIGTEALATVLVELVRSATCSFERVALVNGHGGNAQGVIRALTQLTGEGRDVLAWSPRWEGDAHAGRTETSLQLALDPARVRDERPVGATGTLISLIPELRAGGVASVSPTGVLGDATGANASEGRDLLDALVDDCCDALRSRWGS